MLKLSDEERKQRKNECNKAWRAANPRYGNEWYEKNKEKTIARTKLWQKENPEKFVAILKKYRGKNADKCRERTLDWVKKNSGIMSAYTAKYRANKIRATPIWANQDAIEEFYKEASKKGMHVDHIIPLRGKKVSGLHVHNNLQMLTKSENSKKSNSFKIEG